MKLGTHTVGHASLNIGVAKALPIAMRGKVYEISHVHTEPEYRGQGEATDLMTRACFDADLAGKFLMIHVEPGDDCPLDSHRLAAFYGKFGFNPIQAEPLLMVRPCIGTLA